MTTQNPPPDRPIAPQQKAEDVGLDTMLRPQRLAQFTGQERLKDNLRILIEAARGRGEPLDHVLFHGPPGLGKTTLAQVVANEMRANIRHTAGPAIEHSGDLAAILSNMRSGDILFIDEVHRLSRPVEEILYPAMEDFVLDLIVGKGPGAKNVRLKLPRFTVIGATTRLALMTAPLRARFGAVYRMDFYDQAAMEEIVGRGARILEVPIEPLGMSCLLYTSEDPRVTGAVNDLGDLRIWIDIGEGDPYLSEALPLHEALTAAGVAHEWHVEPGTHEEAFWRARLEQYLMWYCLLYTSRCV